MKRTLVVIAVAVASAIPVANGLALSGTVRAAGTVRASGTAGATGYFSIDLSRGKGGKIIYRQPGTHESFHSQTLGSIRFSSTAVRITGTGSINGTLVPFTMVATDHPAPMGDWFHISWAHGPSHGGRLTSGNIDIALLLSGVNGGGNTPYAA